MQMHGPNNALNNGSPNYSRFDFINFPEGLSGNAVLVVDSFIAQNLNGELRMEEYTVHLKEVLQPKSYDAFHDGPTDIILAGKGGIVSSSKCRCYMACGIPINRHLIAPSLKMSCYNQRV
jgi:hypothetical protein